MEGISQPRHKRGRGADSRRYSQGRHRRDGLRRCRQDHLLDEETQRSGMARVAQAGTCGRGRDYSVTDPVTEDAQRPAAPEPAAAPPAVPAIRTVGLTKRYGSFLALRSREGRHIRIHRPKRSRQDDDDPDPRDAAGPELRSCLRERHRRAQVAVRSEALPRVHAGQLRSLRWDAAARVP